MRLNSYLTILHVSILAATLEADSEDSSCEIVVKVRRNIVYNASVGGHLRINCTIEFCSSSPPAVLWFKNEGTFVPVNVSGGSHIKTEWIPLEDLEGTWSLVFKHVLKSDSGEYHCRLANGLTVSHTINISVYDDDEPTNITQRNDTNNEVSDPEPSDLLTFWPFVYRVVGIMVFVMIVTIIFVISKPGCKGVCCARGCGNPSDRPSHIYENDQ